MVRAIIGRIIFLNDKYWNILFSGVKLTISSLIDGKNINQGGHKVRLLEPLLVFFFFFFALFVVIISHMFTAISHLRFTHRSITLNVLLFSCVESIVKWCHCAWGHCWLRSSVCVKWMKKRGSPYYWCRGTGVWWIMCFGMECMWNSLYHSLAFSNRVKIKC